MNINLGEPRDLVDGIAKEIEAEREITKNPEDRKPPECETCGDRGLIENADGDKEPCPECTIDTEEFNPETGEITDDGFNF